ncbi:hypothetical protein VTK56DRAFT_3859 [Thermocarpiscus australiensis]
MTTIPKTMSGILIEEHGGVEVLKWKTNLPVPQLKEGEVLIRNEFIGVNYIDTYFRTGLYKAPLPLITGREGAGTVVAVHPTARTSLLTEGDRVAYIGEQGAYAELTALPADKVTRVPDGLSTELAAASMLQGLTALTFIREAAGIGQDPAAGEGLWVLVHAAAGGTGSQLVQMLRVMGARVIGTAGGPAKCEVARQNGARWVVDYAVEDVVARVREITDGHGVDVIFDGVGKATFESGLQMITRKGTLVIFGNASGPVDPFNILRLMEKNIKLVRPSVVGYIVTKEERDRYAKELFDLLLSGKVNVRVHEIYPLEEVARAHSDLEGRKTTGKLLLRV